MHLFAKIHTNGDSVKSGQYRHFILSFQFYYITVRVLSQVFSKISIPQNDCKCVHPRINPAYAVIERINVERVTAPRGSQKMIGPKYGTPPVIE